MNLAAPVQTRVLVLVALAAALGLAAFMMMRSGATGSDESTPSVSARAPVTQTPAGHVPAPVKTPARPAKPVKPAVVLLPGLPHGLAKALRRERVVVALVYAPHAGDLGALKQARAGAHEVGAGFVALNVFDERTARPLEQLVGPISDPSVLVVKRPGKVAMRFDGFADAATVAQAAHNAGAR